MRKFDDSVDIEKLIREVKFVMKTEKNVRMYKRYSVILKHLQGFSNKDIAKMESLEAHAVGNYIKKYHESGLNSLKIKYSPGAPRKMNPQQELELVDIITNNIPEDVGFESRCK